MLNKKGFTLIELLAVILLLGLIIGISSPTIVTLINNSREKSKYISYQNIKKSANLYSKENIDNIKWVPDKDEEYTCVKITELIDKGLIKENTVKDLDFQEEEADYKDYSVKVTRNKDTLSITKEEITNNTTCNTNLNLDINSITTTKNSIEINATCTSNKEESSPQIQYKLEDGNYDTKNNFTNLEENKKYKYSVKCESGEDTIIKQGSAYTANFGDIEITVSNHNACTENKTITLSNINSNKQIYYKVGKNDTWKEYKNEIITLEKNATIYASHDNGKSNVVSKTITNIDNGNIKIISHNASNIKTTSATINYGSNVSSTCIKNYKYKLEYGKTPSYGNTKTNTNGSSFNLTGLSSATTYHYRLTISNSSGKSDSITGIFKTHSIPKIIKVENSSNNNQHDGAWTNEKVWVSVVVEDTVPVNRVEHSYDEKTWYSTGFGLTKKEGNRYIFNGYWTNDINKKVYFRAYNDEGEYAEGDTTVKIDTEPPIYTIRLKKNGKVLAKYEEPGIYTYDGQITGEVDIEVYGAKDPKIIHSWNNNEEKESSGLDKEFIFSYNAPGLSSWPEESIYVKDEKRTLDNSGNNTRTISSAGNRSFIISLFDNVGNTSKYEIKIEMLNTNIDADRYYCNNNKLSIYHITTCPDNNNCNYNSLNGIYTNNVFNDRSHLTPSLPGCGITNKYVCTNSGGGLYCRSGATSSATAIVSIPHGTLISAIETSTANWSYNAYYGCYLYSGYLSNSQCPVNTYSGGSSSGGSSSGGSSSGGSSSGGYSGSGNNNEVSTTTTKTCYCGWCNTSKGKWEVTNNGYKTQYACGMGCRGGTPGWGSKPTTTSCKKKTSSGCFLAGTKVKTNNGYKDIDKIQEGDIVLTYNEDTKKNEYQKVLKLLIHNDLNEKLYTLSFDDESELQVTEAHRFYIKRNNKTDWIAAKDLKIGDYVRYSNGKYHKIINISSKEIKETVYNLSVNNNHNYFVGEQQILVHNAKVKN